MGKDAEMPIIIENSGEIVSSHVLRARTFFERAMGLLGTKRLGSDECLIIEHCNQVHTFLMSYEIDVIFCDKNNIVLDTHQSLSPWRISKRVKGASYVIELAKARVAEIGIFTGDRILIS